MGDDNNICVVYFLASVGIQIKERKLIMRKNYTNALKSSIEEGTQITNNVIESIIDTTMNDGFAKNFPIIGTLISALKLTFSLADRIYLQKVLAFIKSINDGLVSEEDRENYIKHFKNDEKIAKEAEYVFIELERKRDKTNCKYMGMLYLEYIRGSIDYLEFARYCSILDLTLPGDMEFLEMNSFVRVSDNFPNPIVLRLAGLGLMSVRLVEPPQSGFGALVTNFEKALSEKEYKATSFAITLISILFWNNSVKQHLVGEDAN